MIKRIIAVVVLVPLAVIIIALSVANRHSVSLTLDPFHPGNPALSYSAPLFVWLFAALFLGLIVGGPPRGLARPSTGRCRGSAARKPTGCVVTSRSTRKPQPSPDMSGALPAPR